MLSTLMVCLLAAFPAPTEAGFHHCALIYDAPTRTADDLRHYVATDDQWLFDAFLFLIQTTPGGGQPMEGGTRLADWQYHLDRWFADGRDVPELDQAIGQARQQLGPAPARQVMFSIPRPDPAVTDFGDVDGDGVSESLATPEGRKKVVDWYLDTLRRRFDALAPSNLLLWGGYVMAEQIPARDEALALEMSAACHERGLKLLWIPWYQATGWDRWREVGVDVAIMQPNYAFLSVHHGKLRRDRLANCADQAWKHGLGVEMELAMAYEDPGAERLWRHYLADGAAGRWGYQQAASAWYLGTKNVEALARSEEPRLLGMYDAMVAYLVGETVPDGDVKLDWRGPEGALPWLGDGSLKLEGPVDMPEWAEAELPERVEGGTVDLFFDRAAAPAWAGEIVLQSADKPGQAPFQEALRLVPPRIGEPSSTERFYSVTLDWQGAARRLRVGLFGDGAPAGLSEIRCTPALFGDLTRHAAMGRAYTFEPAPQAAYGDEGGWLTDGDVPANGFPDHRSVGWYGQDAAVSFDLGQLETVLSAEAVVQGGGMGAVNWPLSAVLVLSEAGTPPTSLVQPLKLYDGDWYAATSVEPLRERRPDDQDGVLRFEVPGGRQARYAAILLEGRSWLMLHEIRLLGEQGRNLVAGRPYALSPAPTPKQATEAYPDDGVRLTDGLIAQRFSKSQVTGWADDEPRTVTVDLRRSERRDAVTVWSLAGGKYGIWAPGEVQVSVSGDGVAWRGLTVTVPAAEEPGDRDMPVAYPFAAGDGAVRFVRVTVRRSKGWAMLSEIEVH